MVRLMKLQLEEKNRASGKGLGMGPTMLGLSPLPAVMFRIVGLTTDTDGVTIIPGCVVHLFRTADDVEIDIMISDANGVFEFRGAGAAQNHYCVSYLPGSPDKAGTTVNTLVGAP